MDCCFLDSSGASGGILLISGIGGWWEKVTVCEGVYCCMFF